MAAKFIRYENSPVFLSPTENVAPQTGLSISNLIAASSCEINFDASLDANKFLGVDPISNDFSVSGPKRSTISLSYIPLVGGNTKDGIEEASLTPFSMTGDFVSGHSLKIGNFLFKQCYLDTLSFQLQSYQPIRCSAQFTSYDSVLLENDVYNGVSGAFSALVDSSSGSYLSCLHALSTNVSGDSVSLPESKTEISVNYQCSRTAVYEVGSLTPKTVLLQGVSRSTSIVGENIGRVISYSGNNASLNLSIGEFGKLTNGGFNPLTDTKLFIGITGRVVSQNLSFATNRIADGSISLVENLY